MRSFQVTSIHGQILQVSEENTLFKVPFMYVTVLAKNDLRADVNVCVCVCVLDESWWRDFEKYVNMMKPKMNIHQTCCCCSSQFHQSSLLNSMLWVRTFDRINQTYVTLRITGWSKLFNRYSSLVPHMILTDGEIFPFNLCMKLHCRSTTQLHQASE